MSWNELESFDRQRQGRVYQGKVEIWRRWHEWKAKCRERSEYGWTYKCGCKAPLRERSEPYCPVHGMRLMRYKKMGK